MLGICRKGAMDKKRGRPLRPKIMQRNPLSVSLAGYQKVAVFAAAEKAGLKATRWAADVLASAAEKVLRDEIRPQITDYFPAKSGWMSIQSAVPDPSRRIEWGLFDITTHSAFSGVGGLGIVSRAECVVYGVVSGDYVQRLCALEDVFWKPFRGSSEDCKIEEGAQ